LSLERQNNFSLAHTNKETKTLTVYSIGYQGITLKQLLEIMQRHNIEILCDVRTQPYSRQREFCRASLEKALGPQYHFEGDRLGGKTGARTAFYTEGLADLKRTASIANVLLLCMETNPDKCHRKNWIAADLKRQFGMTVEHLEPPTY
jgi:uncharacterized protein (DUF488 family)